MSGIKETYVQLTTSQRDSMLRQCREAQESAARERKERERQVAAVQNEANARVFALGNQFNTQIAGLAYEMRAIEQRQNAAFNSALQRQNESFSNALNRQGAELRREIQQQGEHIRLEMQEQRQELTQMINALEQRINEKEQGQKERAEFWVEQAECFIRSIDEYRHELFMPNRLSIIRSRLQQAQSSISFGDHQAAISSAQEAFNSAVSMRSDVVQAELEWERYFQLLSCNLARLSATINSAKLLEFEIGDEKVDAKIDYWTNGALVRLSERVSAIQQILKEPDKASSDTLVTLISEVDDLTQRLTAERSGLIDSAKENMMLSAYRVDMVNSIAEAMQKEGWNQIEYGFKGDEEKDELHIKIGDVNGNEMVVVISPQFNEQGRATGNALEFNFFNDRELAMENAEIAVASVERALSDVGIQTNLRCTAGFERRQSNRNQLRDIKQTRRRKTES